MNEKAFEELGIHWSSTPKEVKERWRTLASENHPDKGGDSTKFIYLRGQYQIAYKEALRYYNGVEDPCGACHGLGKIKTTKGFYELTRICKECMGSGKYRE